VQSFLKDSPLHHKNCAITLPLALLPLKLGKHPQLPVIDHQNPYFSERSPESEGDKIIIRAPGRPERSLLRARVTDHGCPPITPPG